MKLGIYYEGNNSSDIPRICETLRMLYPFLECNVIGALSLPPQAWDTFKGQYDVHYLLDYLMIAEGTSLSLWIVNQDIGDPGHYYLFGAAGRDRAIVSRARLDSTMDIAKEACHEIGHLLGLGHCTNDCVMKVSWSGRAVEKKRIALCQTCVANLNLSKEE